MPTTDMRIDLNFVDHPKIKRLIRKSGYESFYGLLRLFSIAGKMYHKGIFYNCSADDIEDFADWRGEQGAFIASVVDVGFLVKTEEGFTIHEWEEHQPWIFHADERSDMAKKSINKRWKKRFEASQYDSDTERIRNEYDTNTQSNTPLPYPLPLPTPKPKHKEKNKELDLSVLDSESLEFKEAMSKFVEHRKQIKKPMTQLAFDTMINQLDCYSDSERIASIQESIVGGWAGVFPKKGSGNNAHKQEKYRQPVKSVVEGEPV